MNAYRHNCMFKQTIETEQMLPTCSCEVGKCGIERAEGNKAYTMI